MIVVYNPIILFETVAAGGLSFATSKIFPKLPKSADTFLFLSILAALDLLFRFWLVRKKPTAAPKPNEPITPSKPPSDWSWTISLSGGHFLLVPGWVIGVIGCFFTVVL
jgi:hypothetical protein